RRSVRGGGAPGPGAGGRAARAGRSDRRHHLRRRPARLGRHQGHQVRPVPPRDLRRLHGRALPPLPGARARDRPPPPRRPRPAPPMRVAVHPDPAATARAAAERAAALLRDAIAVRGRAAFVAATGLSQVAFLQHLVAAPGIDWGRTALFHLDEYRGAPAAPPASLRRSLRERLTSRVRIGAAHLIEGDAPDLAGELARLGRLLAANPIDVAFLGLGENAHVAFNDPPADFETEAPFLLVDLDEGTRRQQLRAGWFASLDAVPRRAVPMSIRQVVRARRH